MKFALDHAKSMMGKTLILHFFFNARGSELEKSTLGLYRSLLYQLLQLVPEIQHVLDSIPESYAGSGSDVWALNFVKDLFEAAIKRLDNRSLVCYIDALDECDEDEIRDMVSFLQDLCDRAMSEHLKLRICLSSRHYPYISIDRGLSIVLEKEEHHDDDIANYIASELRIGNGEYVRAVRRDIQEKSSGIFMWVVLVVRILNKEYDRGFVPALRKRLEEIPRGLHELFENILTRDSDNLEHMWLCIQWVLFARRPFAVDELYFAILAGIPGSNLGP
ncbi:purine and uridine phosphorylase [Pleurostoma richardsiae]|uniref:Purine and uridine phosphorylase n=1 Tax=Pleurostoma richardsiae TaxID=41990 RepID=A0AA38S128_9PEZI|nr:purine and uridine phosphorylase [Pleurostoma richardsiae]